MRNSKRIENPHMKIDSISRCTSMNNYQFNQFVRKGIMASTFRNKKST